MTPPLLYDITRIDFRQPSEAEAFGTLLTSYAGSCGFGEDLPLAERARLKSVAARWTEGVRTTLPEMAPGDALRLLVPFEFVGRTLLGRRPDRALTFRYVAAALDARIRGDKGVDVYLLQSLVKSGLDAGVREYFGRPLQWHSLMLERWHREARAGIYSADADLPLRDVAMRATLLLADDLWVFERDQESFKRHLFLTLKPTLDNLSGCGCPTLEALLALLNAGMRFIPEEEWSARAAGIYSALREKAPSPWLRAAAEYALENCKAYC